MAPVSRSLLFVLPNGGRGGTQQQVRLVANALARRGFLVAVAVGGGGLDPIDGVEIMELPRFSARWPLPFARALHRARRARRADIVHGHGLRLAPLVAWSGSRQVFVTCHGLDPRQAARTVRRVRRSSVTFVSCGEGPRALLALYGLRSRVLDNATRVVSPPATDSELRQEFGLAPNVPVCVLPARFTEQKNHRGLVDALRRVREIVGEASPEVVCLGDGPLRDEVEIAARHDDRPLLRCFDYRADVDRWLGASSFFVLPSRWEGQPLVVLEALAYGLSIATMTPVGVEDLVLDGRNGRCVQSPHDLADVIIQWCREPSARLRDDALTSEILARHHVDVVCDAYERLYDTTR